MGYGSDTGVIRYSDVSSKRDKWSLNPKVESNFQNSTTIQINSREIGRKLLYFFKKNEQDYIPSFFFIHYIPKNMALHISKVQIAFLKISDYISKNMDLLTISKVTDLITTSFTFN